MFDEDEFVEVAGQLWFMCTHFGFVPTTPDQPQQGESLCDFSRGGSLAPNSLRPTFLCP